jgi:hypothetical protein
MKIKYVFLKATLPLTLIQMASEVVKKYRNNKVIFRQCSTLQGGKAECVTISYFLFCTVMYS